MRRYLSILLCAGMVLSLVACGQTEEAAVEEEPVKETSVEEALEVALEEEAAPTQASSDVDLDLTALTSTMVYSEVFNMMMEPDSYIDSTVRIGGSCNVYQDPNTGKVYYACIVKDATQCCSQGLEFVLDEEKYTADDYPENGEDIVVVGKFATYQENGNQYLTILDSVLE